jgi:hypothetical protein
MMVSSFVDILRRNRVDWEATDESKVVFQVLFQGKIVRLRLNDFPDEPICTVIVDEEETDVEPFPETWTLPKHREGGS